MADAKVKIVGDQLQIATQLTPGFPLSPSGKSHQVASTNGNHKVGLQVEGHDLIVGLNAYWSVKE